MLLSGEAGVGKTTVLQQWIASVRTGRGCWWARASAELPRPLAPLLDVLPGMGAGVPADPDAGA